MLFMVKLRHTNSPDRLRHGIGIGWAHSDPRQLRSKIANPDSNRFSLEFENHHPYRERERERERKKERKREREKRLLPKMCKGRRWPQFMDNICRFLIDRLLVIIVWTLMGGQMIVWFLLLVFSKLRFFIVYFFF